MTVKTFLFDADGNDRGVDLTPELVAGIGERQLLWVDVLGLDQQELTRIGELFGLKEAFIDSVLTPESRPHLHNFGSYFELTVLAVRTDGNSFKQSELELVAGQNYVVTIHADPIEFLKQFDEQIRGDTDLGTLDSAQFVAALLDWHITGYFQVLESLEKRVDRLDELALAAKAGRRFLHDLVAIRRTVGDLRRALVPHREVYSTLARPDFEAIAKTRSADSFTSLHDRLERLVESIENARDMVIGTFELFSTKTAQDTNDVVKFLTVITVVIGLLGVIAGVMGMNFPDVGFFHTGIEGFLITIGVMVVLTVLTLVLARWRGLI